MGFEPANPHKYWVFADQIGVLKVGRKWANGHKMLENMFIGDPVGNTDRLLDFSTPITGTLFFAPSYDLLAKLGE